MEFNGYLKGWKCTEAVNPHVDLCSCCGSQNSKCTNVIFDILQLYTITMGCLAYVICQPQRLMDLIKSRKGLRNVIIQRGIGLIEMARNMSLSFPQELLYNNTSI